MFGWIYLSRHILHPCAEEEKIDEATNLPGAGHPGKEPIHPNVSQQFPGPTIPQIPLDIWSQYRLQTFPKSSLVSPNRASIEE
jgi:hypothetical protein